MTQRRAAHVALDRTRNTVALTVGESDDPRRVVELPAGLKVSVAVGGEKLTFSSRGLTRETRWMVEGAGGREMAIDVHPGERPGDGRTRPRVSVVKSPATMLRSERGFTLVEVLVALLILAIAVVAVLQLFGGGLRLARASGDHLEAILLAEAKMTEVEGADPGGGCHRGHRGRVPLGAPRGGGPEPAPQGPTSPSSRRASGWPGSVSRSAGVETARSSW